MGEDVGFTSGDNLCHAQFCLGRGGSAPAGRFPPNHSGGQCMGNLAVKKAPVAVPASSIVRF